MVSIHVFRLQYEAIEKGRWIRDIPDLPGLSLWVRGLSYQPFADDMDLLDRRIEQSKAPWSRERKYAAIGALLAKHILRDWDGLTSANPYDGPIDYSQQRAEDLLTDPLYAGFVEVVWNAAAEVDATPLLPSAA